MPIYTKKGDKGKTSLYDPTNQQTKRVSKSSLIIQTIGAIDEINSYLGIIESLSKPDLQKQIVRVQKNLFTINANLSGAKLALSNMEVKNLEEKIDNIEISLPVLKNFILPGGTPLAAHLQYARALTRRAERRLTKLSRVSKLDPNLQRYINRLSDYLFTLARHTNHQNDIKDHTWSSKVK